MDSRCRGNTREQTIFFNRLRKAQLMKARLHQSLLIPVLLALSFAGAAAPASSLQKMSAQELIGLIEAGHYRQAEIILRRNLQRGSDRPGVRYLYGHVMWKMLHYEEAEIAYRQAIEMKPEQSRWLHELATILSERGRCVEAIKMLDRALDHDPSPEYRYDRAICAHNIGLSELARSDLKQVLASQPDHAAAHLLYAEVLIDAGISSTAVQHLQRAIRLRPELADAWFQVGRIRSEQNSLDAAESAFRTALRLQPNHPGARLALGRLLVRTDRMAEGKTHLEVFREQQQRRELIENRLQYLERDPRDLAARLELVRLYLGEKNSAEARIQLEVLHRLGLDAGRTQQLQNDLVQLESERPKVQAGVAGATP